MLTVISLALICASRFREHKKHGTVFPRLDPRSIRFDEAGASGRSDKPRFGGAARRCLQVTVTDTEVWVRLGFPFNVFAPFRDLEQRIPRTSIVSVDPSQSWFTHSLLLVYRDGRGGTHALSLQLRKPDDFVRVLGLTVQRV